MARCFSLREHIKAQGITAESEIRQHLATAYNMIKLVPGINIRRFNIRNPMEGISNA